MPRFVVHVAFDSLASTSRARRDAGRVAMAEGLASTSKPFLWVVRDALQATAGGTPSPRRSPPSCLLMVLVAAPLFYLLLFVAGNKKTASAAAPTSRRDGRRLPLPPSLRGLLPLGHLHLLGALP